MCEKVVEIDGSLLVGGGQILRTSMTLSALLGIPIRVSKIRVGRNKPGLMEEHLRGLELVSSISNGKLKGGTRGSTEIEFWPGRITGGSYHAVIKKVGSVSFLLQVALPCTLYANAETILTLEGGTNMEIAPQVDYMTEVFRPILEKFGATFDFDLIKRSYFPKGGGKVVINVKPIQQLQAVELCDLGSVTAVYGWSFAAGTLPVDLAHTMADAATDKLRYVHGNVKIERYKENSNIAPDNCSGIVLVAETSTGCILGGSALGKRKEKPEKTGEKAAEELLRPLHEGACVDHRSQEQIIILMALAQGCSRVKVGKITAHTETAIYITEKLANVKFEIIPSEECSIIQCNGLARRTLNTPGGCSSSGGSPTSLNKEGTVSGPSSVTEAALQKEPPIKRNRSGAERRRYKKAQAMAKLDASDQPDLSSTSVSSATAKVMLSAGGSKRSHSEEETSPSAQKAAKRVRPGLSSNQVANKDFKVAITQRNFPESQITEEQAKEIQVILGRYMDGLPDEGPFPKYNGFRRSEQGIILITCSDAFSKTWLREAVDKISLETGIELAFLEGDPNRRLRTMMAWIPGASEDVATILKRLKRQNPGLLTDLWRIRHAGRESKGFRLVLGVDGTSRSSLEKLGMKAYAGMVRVSFWEPKHAKDKPAVAELKGREALVSAAETEEKPAVAELKVLDSAAKAEDVEVGQE